MQVTFLGIVSLIMLGLSIKASKGVVVGVFAVAALLQAAAAFFIGNNGISPAHFLLTTLVLGCLREKNSATKFWQMARFPSPGFFLIGLGIYAVVSAAFFPRLLEGMTYVNPITDSHNPVSYLNPPPLAPSFGNVTQSIYVLGSTAVFFLVGIISDKGRDYDVLLKAILAYTIGNIVFGLLDIITYYTHAAFLMQVIRNSNYVFHTEETAALGLKRIAGSFTETSAFSAVTLSTLAFTVRLGLGGVYGRMMIVLSCVELLLLAFSTSSTALAGLPIVGACLWGTSILRLFGRRFRAQDAAFAVLFPLALVVLTSAITLSESAREAVINMLNAVLFEKSTSESGMERLAFNAQALRNVWDTAGIGVGLGSTRASSYLLALIASVGVPGTLLMVLFLKPVFLAPASVHADNRQIAVQQAARMACFATIVGASISGMSMDLGLIFFVFAAAAYLPVTFVPMTDGIEPLLVLKKDRALRKGALFRPGLAPEV